MGASIILGELSITVDVRLVSPRSHSSTFSLEVSRVLSALPLPLRYDCKGVEVALMAVAQECRINIGPLASAAR